MATENFLIDGVLTELKTVTGSAPTSIKNALQKAALKPGKPQIIIDARKSGLSAAEALEQAQRAQGNVGGLIGRVRILVTGAEVTF
jgi:hypothetical protein